MVNPPGTGRPISVISARPAPLPPSNSFCEPSPSARPPPKKYTYLVLLIFVLTVVWLCDLENAASGWVATLPCRSTHRESGIVRRKTPFVSGMEQGGRRACLRLAAKGHYLRWHISLRAGGQTRNSPTKLLVDLPSR